MTSSVLKAVFPVFTLLVGGLITISALWPIGQSSLRYFLVSQPQITNPLYFTDFPLPIILGQPALLTVDYTHAQNWFDLPVTQPATPASSVKYFSLSIPSVNMHDVSIEISGSDLKKNAIHFPGTALPGNFGNSVIFGHSALPQFYKPDYPLTIFNPLTKVKMDDRIIVEYDGITYTYRVDEIFEVKPDRIQVLAQKFDRRQITLVTCVPLGTYLRRLVITAELSE